jgi:hypothetical protein
MIISEVAVAYGSAKKVRFKIFTRENTGKKVRGSGARK